MNVRTNCTEKRTEDTVDTEHTEGKRRKCFWVEEDFEYFLFLYGKKNIKIRNAFSCLLLYSSSGSQAGWDIFWGWTNGSAVEPQTSSRQQTWAQVGQVDQICSDDPNKYRINYHNQSWLFPIMPQDEEDKRPDSHGDQDLGVPGSPNWRLRNSGAAGWRVGGALVHGARCPQGPYHRGRTHCDPLPALR